MIKLFNVAHHDPTVWTINHPEVTCDTTGTGVNNKNAERHCSVPRDRIEKDITTVCGRSSKPRSKEEVCERLVKLGPAGNDGRNLGNCTVLCVVERKRKQKRCRFNSGGVAVTVIYALLLLMAGTNCYCYFSWRCLCMMRTRRPAGVSSPAQ